MPQLNAYLFFDGNCADAMRYYQTIFGGKLDLVPVAGSPAEEHMPVGSGDRILHSHLAFDGNALMASDDMPDVQYAGMKHFSLAIEYDDPGDARRIFDKLAEGGSVTMPLGETFFAKAFGMLTDKFGTPWMVTGRMKQP